MSKPGVKLKDIANAETFQADRFRYHPLSKDVSDLLETRQASRVEILSTDKMYEALCKFISDNSSHVQSWRVKFKKLSSNNKTNFHLSEEEEQAKMRNGLLKM